MSIIIETCPKCGHDLQDLVIATYPPIPAKQCFNCGWSWEGEREEVVRVPLHKADDVLPKDLSDTIYNFANTTAEEIQKALKEINNIKD